MVVSNRTRVAWLVLLLNTLLLLGASATADASPLFNITLLTKAAAESGAVCLDGSPGAYYFRPGTGDGAGKWYTHFEGGGWCVDPASCASRAEGTLGSSKGYPQAMVPYGDRGYFNATTIQRSYFSQDCGVNPLTCNWNMVFLRYCDGASFASARAAPLVWSHAAPPLHFRGSAIQDAILASLVEHHGLDDATDVMIGGASAGGLAVYLHADRWRAALPHARVTALPDSGFFLGVDTADHRSSEAASQVHAPEKEGGLVPGKYQTGMLAMVAMTNATYGLNRACVAALGGPGDNRSAACVFAAVSAAHTETPTFALQSAYDAWQTENIMAPGTGDNATLVNAYGGRLRAALHAAVLDRAGARNGGFVASCAYHCFKAFKGAIEIDGALAGPAVAAWYAGGKRRVFEQEDAFPCQACCARGG